MACSPKKASLEAYFSDHTVGKSELRHSHQCKIQSSLLESVVRTGQALHAQKHEGKSKAEIKEAARNAFMEVAADAALSWKQTVSNMAGGFITLADLNRALGRIVPLSTPDDSAPTRGPFRDSEFLRIAELLESYGKQEWSLIPRTYTLLRMVGCPEVIEDFIFNRSTDIALPYTEENLPHAVKGRAARSRFLELQKLVLNPHVADLEKAGKDHKHFAHSADEYFVSKRELGSGGFGQVDHVWSRLSHGHFARKRFARGKSFKKDKQAIADFEKELSTLKLLSHRHLVRLIGSYTDPRWVGLIMHPVADMNLATYLNCDMDPQQRQICLRRFYGCLTTAMQYLHDNRIRHKDIKPANILVKGTAVYLTDFGTSCDWNDHSRSTTIGTVPVMTPRYCAPEVADQETRNSASDVWSLGCVFLEMTSVLNNRTLTEMKQFYSTHGTESTYFRLNEEATRQWIGELESKSEQGDDNEPLKLIPCMMQTLGKDRYTAHQTVNSILNFETRLDFYGMCCVSHGDDTQTTYQGSISSDADEDAEYRTGVETPRDLSSIPSSNFVPKGLSLVDLENDTSSITDPGEETTRGPPPEYSDRNQFGVIPASSSSNTTPLNDVRGGEESGSQDIERNLSPPPWPPLDSQSASNKRTNFLELRDSANLASFSCQWPGCETVRAECNFNNKEALERHCLSVHGTHDFSWSRILASSVDATPEGIGNTGQSYCTALVVVSRNKEEEQPKQAKAPANDNRADRYNGATWLTGSQFMAENKIETPLRPRFGIASNETDRKGEDFTNPENSSQSPVQSGKKAYFDTSMNEKVETSNDYHKTPGNNKPTAKIRPLLVDERSRFCLLPENRRPEPTAQTEPESTEPRSPYRYIKPEPLPEALIGSSSASSSGNPSIPPSSRVPSYVLASTNRFTNFEIDAMTSRSRLILGSQPAPLFVYGSFMFPSILRSRAAEAIKGHYSEEHQRRLYPDSTDWARVNMSLKHAAEAMTPAILPGYNRWQPKGLDCAAIKKANPYILDAPRPSTNRPNYAHTSTLDQAVQGFVVFGLSEEALKACDALLCVQNDSIKSKKRWRRMMTLSTEETAPEVRHCFVRKTVQVDIELKNGRMRTMNAITYVWKWDSRSLVHEWDINKFINTTSFAKWSKGDVDWIQEETELARTMRITYVLPGDAICDAVIRDDEDALNELLDQGDDVDASCTTYGTALQAAVVKGNKDMVQLLLDESANVNAEGGIYHNPLLAATANGDEAIVALLLAYGANTLAHVGRFVSPLYQAISHSDEKIVYMLLERGAWLTNGYPEILDLAAEHRNQKIIGLLKDYDVRKVHLRLPSYSDADDVHAAIAKRRSSRGKEVSGMSSAIVRAVISRAFSLHNRPGNWQGIKGVYILEAAIEAGMSPNIVDGIGDHLKTISSLLKFFKCATAAGRTAYGLVPNARRIEDDDSSFGETTLVDESEGDQEFENEKERRPVDLRKFANRVGEGSSSYRSRHSPRRDSNSRKASRRY